MKNIICILIISFSGQFLFAHTVTEPVYKNVIAFSGLKIRFAPGMESQVLTVIPYGAQVEVLEETTISESIEWMSGSWIQVQYQGIEGYIFDGFVTDLSLPSEKFELSQNDLELTYPLLAWAEYNYNEVEKSDTLTFDDMLKVTQYMSQGVTLKREESDAAIKVSLEMENVGISEAYNLLKSMLLTKSEREEYVRKSVFISDNEGRIHRIKINLLSPVEIKQLENGNIKINAVTYHLGCD